MMLSGRARRSALALVFLDLDFSGVPGTTSKNMPKISMLMLEVLRSNHLL